MELLENNLFSIGFQSSFGNRKIDFTNLKWDSQYVNNAYNNNMPPEFMMNKEKYSFVDIATGISWKYNKSRYLKTQLGASLYHINNIKLQNSIPQSAIKDDLSRMGLPSSFGFMKFLESKYAQNTFVARSELWNLYNNEFFIILWM